MRGPVNILRRLILALVGLTLPFEYTRLIPTGTLTLNKLLTALLLVLVALQITAERRPLPRDPKRPWVAFFGVAVTVSAIQSVLAGVPVDTLSRVLTTVYGVLVFYFLMTYTVRRRDDLDLLIRWFAVGAVVTILSGWLGFGKQVEAGARTGARLAGEGGNPNLLAFNLLVAIAGTAALYFSARARIARTAYLGLIAVMTAGVVATLSRSAYVALPLMGLLWAVRFRSLGFVKYAAPGILLVVAAVLLAPESSLNRIATLTPEGIREDTSSEARIQMFPDAFSAFASNPLTGVGLVGYIPWAIRNGTHPNGIHNAFLQVLAEHGLLGFVPFVAITVLTWRGFTQAWRIARRSGARRDGELRALEIRALLLQIGLLGAIVMSMAQPSTHHKSLWLLFALSTAVLGLARERARELTPAEEHAPPGWDPSFARAQQLALRLGDSGSGPSEPGGVPSDLY